MQGLGQLLLILTFLVTLGTALTAMAGATRRNAAMMRAARSGLYAACALYVAMAIILTHGFLSHDFSNMYIATYSDRSMPTIYLLAAFWGGEKGALLFWTTSLCIFSAIAVYTKRDRDPVYISWVVAILMLCIFFFDILMVFESSPFETFQTIAGPEDGKGLNPLLQNPTMAFHPPALLTGYITFTIPFAFAMAALITGKLDSEWITDTRKWTLVSFVFLSTGLVLGMLWAYEEIGWGFWWMWDPVENAGAVPWFTATAFLHSVMIQERRGMFKRWNMILVCLTFWLTIFGTFLTRSQLIDSIHAFAESTLAEYFLWYMLVIALVSVALIGRRWKDLRSEADIESFWSRESFFVLNNVVLVFCSFAVLLGTLFSKLTESTVVRDTYNGFASFFGAEALTQAKAWHEADYNAVMVPLGLVLLILMGAGPLISWRRATVKNFKKNFQIPLFSSLLVVSIGASIGLYMTVDSLALERGISLGEALSIWHGTFELAHVWVFLCYFFALFTTWSLLREFHRGIRVRMKRGDGGYLACAITLTMRAPRRYGGYLVHLGVVFMFLAFSGKHFKVELPERLMKVGDQLKLSDYHLTFARSDQFWDTDAGFAASRAQINVLEEGDTVPESHVDDLATWLKSHDAGIFHIETKTNNPKMAVRFKDESARTRIATDFYLGRTFAKDFNRVMDDAARMTITYRVADMGLIKVMPMLAMQKVRTARAMLGRGDLGAKVLASGGSPEIRVTFDDAKAFENFEARMNGAQVPESIVAAIDNSETGAIEFMDGRTGVFKTPEVRYYAKHQTPTTEASISSGLYRDLYLAIQPKMEMGGVMGMMSQPFINLLPVVFPLVALLWAGSLLLVFGVVVCLTPQWLARTIISVVRPRKRKGAAQASAAVLLAALLAAMTMGYAPPATAHGGEAGALPPPPAGSPPQGDPVEDVLKVLLCSCDSDGRQTIDQTKTLADATCTCGRSERDRSLIRDLMAAEPEKDQKSGRAKVEVLLHLVSKVDPRWDARLMYDINAYKTLMGTTVTTCEGERGLLISQGQVGCSVRRYWLGKWRLMFAAGVAPATIFKHYVDTENIRQAPPKPWSYEDLRGTTGSNLGWALPASIVAVAAFGFMLLMMRRGRRRLASGESASREERGQATDDLSIDDQLRLADELDYLDA